MSAKRKDEQNRWRNKLVSFRMSPEEAEMLNIMAKLSGYSKQDYIISKLLDHSVEVKGNPRIYKALSETFVTILDELREKPEPSPDLLAVIQRITTVMEGLQGETK